MARMFSRPAISAVLLLCMAAAAGARRLDPSSKAAGDLVSLMKARSLDAIAVQDPEAPDRFVAAMLIPGVQLLVVAAQSTSPAYLQAQLAQQQYREVYSTLHSAAVLDTKVFFQDMGCDGLRAGGDGAVDVMYERGAVQTIFDGDWKRNKLSKSEYEEKSRKADAAYSRLLTLLSDALRADRTQR